MYCERCEKKLPEEQWEMMQLIAELGAKYLRMCNKCAFEHVKKDKS